MISERRQDPEKNAFLVESKHTPRYGSIPHKALHRTELSPQYWQNCLDSAVHLWPILIANFLEFYEFYTFSFLEDEITDNFFTESWETWAAFALTAIVRPAGGVLFGQIGDRLGRKRATLLAVYGMTFATVGQGVLPSKKCGGIVGQNIGAIILILLRIIQGFCTGGEVAGVFTYLSESANKESLGMTVSWMGFSTYLGSCCASGLVTFLQFTCSENLMNDWIWRIPFLVAAIPAYLCLRNLAKMEETEEFTSLGRIGEGEKASETENSTHVNRSLDDFMLLLRDHLPEVFYVFFSMAGISSVWYVGQIYFPSFVQDEGASSALSSSAAFVGQLIALVFCIPSGYLTDRYGIGKVLLVGNHFIMIFGLPMFIWLNLYPENSLVVYSVIGGFCGLLGAVAGSSVYLYPCEMFPTHIRHTGTGFGYNMSIMIFGGCGPLFCDLFVKSVGVRLFPGYFMSIAGLLSTCTIWYCRWLHMSGRKNLTHLRPQPY